ncbi:methionine--tRNA ligase subunit beta [Nanoarchaeota archaeon NZ13-N]|uniref:Methionine--tRNA ligase n=1 Tax=Candidatus Nanoclepta minutus TaxID=1940235 RepID=A0A397WM74_9ARCH|nr:MAG: methionine--tRNA ligase subunit beta [Nanoarchaeota archaeon NZ13-N]RIB35194.1 MAG: methionine--tRNA ligase subunit beta [Candidatus Nanoclepta minutus]
MVIDIEEFKKIELRVGEIVEVKDHPNADKLYVLTVDFGNEKRQIVAGIREYYSKEDLLGKKIVVVTNLKPRNIRGVESQGMLLAAEKEGKLSLIIPDPKKEIDKGASVY